MSAPNKAPDLSLLLMRSIVKAQERKRGERLWTDSELETVHEQMNDELWRVSFKGCK